MRVFDIQASSSPAGYLCAKFFSFAASIAELVHEENHILNHSLSHLNHSPRLFDALGTEAKAGKI